LLLLVNIRFTAGSVARNVQRIRHRHTRRLLPLPGRQRTSFESPAFVPVLSPKLNAIQAGNDGAGRRTDLDASEPGAKPGNADGCPNP
jgi:hypothetical protein